jgi:hypothetical protein
MRRIFLILTITLFSVTLIAFAQDTPADDAILILTLGDASCSLVVDMPDAEVTPEPDATSDEPEIPVLTLGEDCEALIPDLLVASNGTLWIALDIPDSEGRADWQTFTSAEESAPLQFDGRGRYVGCANRDAGEQVCALLWDDGETTYRIEIPIFVGEAYIPPVVVDDAVSDDETVTGEWGACGSCDSCGASPDQCVTAPDGACVADPNRCTVRTVNTGGGSSSVSSLGQVCINYTSCDSEGNCEDRYTCYTTTNPDDPCSDPNYGGPCGGGGDGGGGQ